MKPVRRIRAVFPGLGFLALAALPLSGQDIAGVWVLTVDLGAGGGGEATFVLEQDGSAITGTYSGAYGTGVPVSGTAEDERISFTFHAGQIGEITYDGALQGNTMRGTVTYGAVASGTFEGSLAAKTEPLWGGALVSRIDSLAEATLAGGSVAALSIGVQRGGDVLLTRGYGLADIENDVPATAETVYRIGSITKQFTAAAVMQLVQAGEIGLGDLITDHLPDYPMQGHEVTIRHLLTHTSGIKSYTSMESWRPKMRLDLTDEELVAIFGPEPFDFAPGERYLYNNSGYYLLGVIIGEASGEPYQEYLNAHLFGTLDLAGSFYCDERPIFPRDGGLWSQATGQGAFRLRSQGDGTFVPTFDDAVEVSFVVEDARATSLILVQGGRREAPRAR